MEESIIGGGGRRAKGSQANKYGALCDANKTSPRLALLS